MVLSLSSWICQERCGLLSLVLLYTSKYVLQYMSKIKVVKSGVHVYELDRTKDTDEKVKYSNDGYEC